MVSGVRSFTVWPPVRLRDVSDDMIRRVPGPHHRRFNEAEVRGRDEVGDALPTGGREGVR